MKLNYGHGDEEIEVSVYTLVLYEQEFDGRDLIKDVFGKVELRDDSKDDDVVMSLDYRTVNRTYLTKALWAALKTADDSVPHFDKWVKEVGAINMWSLAGDFTAAINANLFRSEDSEQG